MPISMLDQVDFAKIASLNFVAPVVTSDPAPTAADEGRIIYNTTENVIKYCDQTPTWITLGPAGAGGPPTGTAGGDLTGSYPNPQIAAGVIVDNDINASANIAQSKINGLATTLALYLPLTGGTLSNFLTLHADPDAPMKAATKQYVDLASQGFSFKNAARVVATSNVAALSGLAAIDGVTPVANDRILLTAQSTGSQNGIWLAASGAWTRATDMDTNGELKDGTLVPVAQGTANADTLWLCTAIGADPWVAGTSTSTWSKFSNLSDLTAGAGLTKTGTTVDVVSANADMTVGIDNITINSAPRWTTTRTITLTGDATGGPVNIDGTGNVSIPTTVTGAGTGAKHYAANVGAGTSVVINHALNTRDVVVEVYRNSTPWDTVECTVERTDVNNVTLKFAVAVGANAYRCVVTGR